jgi:fructose-1,6-bisphosphatase/inositol monophosphatase family enzyme
MTNTKLEKISIKALKKAFQIHEELGSRGLRQSKRKNQFGETSLLGDIEAEKAVIETFKEARVPIKIISEEHGERDLAEEPIYLGILDGLDGTSVYKRARGKGRYGTMFGVFSNLDPTYDDYIFSGIMEHSTNRLFFASKGKGSFVISPKGNSPIHCSEILKFDEKVRIVVDVGVDKALNIALINDTFLAKLKGHKFTKSFSTAHNFADLAYGATDIVLEATRKRNLEFASGYGLINESGGSIRTLGGEDFGPKKYLSFCQDGYIPVVAASNRQLAEDFFRQILEA